MARSRLTLAVAATIALAGCAGIRQNLGGWSGGTPPSAKATTKQGEVFYAAADGLTVYAESSGSSKVVGQLALHERVIRARQERGYAYIVAESSSLEGWVDNAQLLWRLPAAGETSAPAANQPAKIEGQEPATNEAVAPSEGKGSETAPVGQPAPPAQPPPTSAPPPPPQPRPSVFDPF